MYISMLFQVVLTVIFIGLLVGLVLMKKNFLKEKQVIRNLSKEREIFMHSLKHDLKVTVLAQQRAFEIFPMLDKNEQENILRDLSDSNKYALDMIEMLSSIGAMESDRSLKSDMFDFNELAVSVLEKFIESDSKNNFKISKNIEKIEQMINADRERFQKVLCILLQLAVTRADDKKIFEISNKTEKGKIIFSIKYTPKNDLYEESKMIFDENPEYGSVGQGLKISYCQKVLNYYNSKLEIFDINQYTLKIGFVLNAE